MEAKNMNHKTLDAKFTAGDGITKFTATITTSSIDRDGEVVVPGGMNSKQFEQNPVLLYAHDPAKPIGKMTALRRGESVIDADFALVPRPESHEGEWFPDTVGALMRFGALKGVSIGFAPMAGGMRQATKGDKDKYGVGVARVYSKWNLMEVSVVSVPANQDALILAVTKGIVTASSLKAFGVIATEPAMIVRSCPSQSHRVVISMPSVAHDEIIDIARREVAKMRGHFKV